MAVRSFPALQRLTKTLCEMHCSVHLEDVRGEIGEPRALPAHQGDMPGMRPAAEAIHGIGETGGHLRKVGRIDLGDVAEAGELGARAGAGDQRLHLLRREVLRLVQDQEAVEEGAPAHEVQRADLDPVAQQVVGGRAAPVASLLGPGEHLEIVDERTHPRLHLLLLGAGQEADVFAERDGHARHDDFHEAVGFQRLHEAGGERQQRLAGAGWPEHRDEVDFRIHQQVEREVLLTVARRDAPDIVALVAMVARQLDGDRKSTRLNSSHGYISYAVFCLKKKTVETIEAYLSSADRAKLAAFGPAVQWAPAKAGLSRYQVDMRPVLDRRLACRQRVERLTV